METARTSSSFTKWKPIEIMLALLFLVAPFYYHPNIGGEGLRTPNNITVWIMVTIIIWYSLYQVLKRPTFVLPKYFIYIASFPILITLSGFVTGVEQPLKWLFRLLFIWGGLAFFFSLFQHKLKQGRVDRILLVIVISALLQGLVSIAQIYLQADMPFWLPTPNNGVPSGLFQQINNLATYQVTAIMIAAYLVTRPIMIYGKGWMLPLVLASVVCASFLVIASGSRIGALTLILGLAIVMPSLWKRFVGNKKVSLIAFGALLIGVGLGIIIDSDNANTSNASKIINKTIAMESGYSGSARLGIYNISSGLITQQPLFGHGIGSFPRVWQYAKPDFYRSHSDAILPQKYVSHPHNELLFWLVEGGIIAGVGLVMVLLGVILALKRLGWQRGGAYAAILLPISLHAQVELPFYTSAVHWLLFILIFFMIFQMVSIRKRVAMSMMAIKTMGYVNAIIFTSLLLFLAQTMRAHGDFYDFYHAPLSEQVSFKQAYMNPYLNTEAQWINMSSTLYSSMEMGLHDNVRAYIHWGEKLLLEKPDVDLYKKLADGYSYLGDTESFCKTIAIGLSLYPQKAEFQQAFTSCKK
ncbi:MAG: Wzy polymerase domain-containing protein [Methylophagaceae bacterium]